MFSLILLGLLKIIDNSGNEDNVYLAQFGGTIAIGDYVIISRDDGIPSGDGVDDEGEVFKVKTLIDQVAKKFRISGDCDSSDGDVFIVDSVTGDTTIKGDVIINNGLTINGGCDSPIRGTITGSITGTYKDVASEFITAISDADIANVEIGDLVKFDPAENYTRFSIYPRTRIKEIRYATDNNTIVLNRRLEVDATFTVKVVFIRMKSL